MLYYKNHTKYGGARQNGRMGAYLRSLPFSVKWVIGLIDWLVGHGFLGALVQWQPGSPPEWGFIPLRAEGKCMEDLPRLHCFFIHASRSVV